MYHNFMKLKKYFDLIICAIKLLKFKNVANVTLVISLEKISIVRKLCRTAIHYYVAINISRTIYYRGTLSR